MKIKKTYLLIVLFIFIIILLVLGVGNFYNNFWKIENNNKNNLKNKKYFAILPHFMIKEKRVDKFYYLLKKKYFPKNNIDNIVLISPNHFGIGEKKFETFCGNTQKKICFKNSCVNFDYFSGKKIGCGKGYKYTDKDNLFYLENNKYLTKEHGIGGHFKFVKKYFPESKVFPIVIRDFSLNKSSYLIDLLKNYNFKGNTLFISSVDFSHHVQEDFAKIHDKKTFYTLKNTIDKKSYKELEVDCRSCLYILNSLADNYGYRPFLWKRDSSSDIFNIKDGDKNTSRQFFYYKRFSGDMENGITLAFFGDLIYDRHVKKLLNTKKDIKKHFSGFYQKGRFKKDSKLYRHKKLFGLDFAGFNLETPIVKKREECDSSGKKVSFCSKYKILPVLKEIGFNIVNIANNHTMDFGLKYHKNTIKNLEKSDINYFGYVKDRDLFKKNYVFTGTERGIKYAWLGFDYTVTPNLINKYCDIIKKHKNKNFLNILSIHWGEEYKRKVSKFQKNLAKKLIDCGGDIILGHGPHVVQKTNIYNKKLIVYSLGNFLFDQNISKYTKKGGYVVVDIKENGDVRDYYTGDIKAIPDY